MLHAICLQRIYSESEFGQGNYRSGFQCIGKVAMKIYITHMDIQEDIVMMIGPSFTVLAKVKFSMDDCKGLTAAIENFTSQKCLFFFLCICLLSPRNALRSVVH